MTEHDRIALEAAQRVQRLVNSVVNPFGVWGWVAVALVWAVTIPFIVLVAIH